MAHAPDGARSSSPVGRAGLDEVCTSAGCTAHSGLVSRVGWNADASRLSKATVDCRLNASVLFALSKFFTSCVEAGRDKPGYVVAIRSK
jgi:hypothetical protein